MRRLNQQDRAAHDKIVHSDIAGIETLLQKGYPPVSPSPSPSQERGRYPKRTITDYATYYNNCIATEGVGCLPSDVMGRTMKQVEAWDLEFDLKVFSSILPHDVMGQAQASDARFKAGTPLSIMDGVPVAIKDDIQVKGHTIYHGKSKNATFESLSVSTVDDVIVQRLRDLGAIVFGVSIMVELGVSPLGYNVHWKGPVNAFDGQRYARTRHMHLTPDTTRPHLPCYLT